VTIPDKFGFTVFT